MLNSATFEVTKKGSASDGLSHQQSQGLHNPVLRAGSPATWPEPKPPFHHLRAGGMVPRFTNFSVLQSLPGEQRPELSLVRHTW